MRREEARLDPPTDGVPLGRAERGLLWATQGLAVAGGIVLIVLAAVTVYSIVGRTLPDLPGLAWWRPLRGDFELVELGTALAIFAFLPYAHLTRANVVVDLLTARASARTKALLAVPANLLLTVLSGLLTWKMTEATLGLLTASYRQTTMLLRVPLGWAYLPATVCMAFLTVVAAFTAWRSIREARAVNEARPRRP